ncbi:MAG: hypothetical protein DHS20C11_38600 [Lysobacteraceae bacterium]|nr:MAG: hypothetical protein DHS20C11_38600 [Xanthomonadaceae bacterium]
MLSSQTALGLSPIALNLLHILGVSVKKIISIAVVLSAVFSMSALADAVYSYSGPNFGSAGGIYTTDMRVDLSFSLANPLDSNLVDADISGLLLGWQFNDGVQTLGNHNSSPIVFTASTDAEGNLIGWSMTVWKTPLPTAEGERLDAIGTFYDPDLDGGFANDNGIRNGRCDFVVMGVCTQGSGRVDIGDYLEIGVAPRDIAWAGGAVQPVPSSSTVGLWMLALLMVAVALVMRHKVHQRVL